METTGQVTYDGDGWRLLNPKHWTQAQWRAACHFPHGVQSDAGLGRVVVVCGLGLPPEAAACPDVRTATLTSLRDDEIGGTRCKEDAWEQMTGRVREDEPDVPGAAQGATYLTTPLLGLDYASTAGGKACEWLLRGLDRAADVLVLPPTNGGDVTRWLGAIRMALSAGTVLVGPWNWIHEFPDDAGLICPAPWRMVDGVLAPVGPFYAHARVTSVPVFVEGNTAVEIDRRATALTGALVAMSLASQDPRSVSAMGRVRVAHQLVRHASKRQLETAGVTVPSGHRGFRAVYAPLDDGGMRQHCREHSAAAAVAQCDNVVPPDLNDPRR